MWIVKLSKQALKDRDKLRAAGLLSKTKKIIDVISNNPFQNPPPYEKLVGNLNGFYSRRLNIKHRLVYTVHQEESIVVVRSLWTHYER